MARHTLERACFLGLLEANVLRSEHFIYHTKNTKKPRYTGYFEKNKGVTFHSWGRRVIPERYPGVVHGKERKQLTIQDVNQKTSDVGNRRG